MKYFFSDVDGTLLQDHKLDVNTVEAIKSFVNKGNKFILATGRIDADIKNIEEKMGVFGEYRISQNGAVVKDKNNNVLYKKLLPKDIITDLTKYVYSLEDVTIEITEVDNRYSTTERKISYTYEFTTPVIIEPNLKNKISSLECTLFLILSDNEELFKKINLYIKENFGNSVYAVLTSPGCLEIISNEVSKGNAVSYLQNLLNIKNENIFVAGDSYNDTSMFEKYSNSFVMLKAPVEVKEKAKNVVPSVADVIKVIEETI